MSYYYDYDSDSEDGHAIHAATYLAIVEQPAYCQQCDRTFLNEHNLQQHLRSSTHRGTGTPRPFCSRGFSTATGLVHHLETGSCPRAPGIDREAIFRIMKQRDPNGYVTNLLLKYESATYSTSQRSWNGRAWQCYFCDREFRTKASLDQHVNSPVRESRVVRGAPAEAETSGGGCRQTATGADAKAGAEAGWRRRGRRTWHHG